MGEEFCRDFVRFENENGAWVIDAGEMSSSAKEERSIFVRAVGQKDLINNFYESLQSQLFERSKNL